MLQVSDGEDPKLLSKIITTRPTVTPEVEPFGLWAGHHQFSV